MAFVVILKSGQSIQVDAVAFVYASNPAGVALLGLGGNHVAFVPIDTLGVVFDDELARVVADSGTDTPDAT